MAKINSEKIQDIDSSYGIDVENELSSMLSEQIAMSIDSEIIKNIFMSHKGIRIKKSKNILNKIKKKEGI
jgi:hypothetical protein